MTSVDTKLSKAFTKHATERSSLPIQMEEESPIPHKNAESTEHENFTFRKCHLKCKSQQFRGLQA